ncbi:MAG: hypothetical protein OJJ21_08665 [Ferrovibrio sp.]|uniref:hypothetical protein n=1 Tax=Ferrovibrio sp. TaxID=1917215 RepID=UPI0026093FC7|nr:hypothetical protein [Ferrovibrio sp.]MCW0233655.1 hypothetical protein [Ferrovibrio sp.]
MNISIVQTERYARCIENSRKVNWDIDKDVLQGRSFDYSRKFLPDGLSLIAEFGFLSDDEKRLLSQVQGRTYAYLFGMIERCINAKILDISRGYALGDQVALEALVRFSAEELKHQELFRRIEQMIAKDMPEGYIRTADGNAVAEVVLSKSNWAVLALTCHIELFTLVHYRESIEPDTGLSPLFKDIFLHHWREESQHAVLDELEWIREDARIPAAEKDVAVDDLIALVGAVDGILQGQAKADAAYFRNINKRTLGEADAVTLQAGLLKAYRWTYILSGVQVPRFQELLGSMITEAQFQRIQAALAPIM